MFDSNLTLISRTPTNDRGPRGQLLYTEEKHDTVCEVVPVSRDEYFRGAINGIACEHEFKINPIEYNNEKFVEYEGKRYSIYRTYQASPDELELYVEFVPGINGGVNNDP